MTFPRLVVAIGRVGSAIALAFVCSAAAQVQAPIPQGWTLLRLTEGAIEVHGKKGKAYSILQPDGTPGYVGTKGERFKVLLENQTTEPVAIHWHGLLLANGQDGVPYVTQPPIKPGERRAYDFPILQAGTYWMHSHFGFQEQPMMTAPLILKDPATLTRDEQDVVMMLNDFTVRDPAAILAELQGKDAKSMAMPGMAMGSMKPGMRMAGADLNDVKYDAFLTNRRTLADPEVVRVKPGQTVRLRIIAAGSASNFFIDTGTLETEAVAVDGEDILPLPGHQFELAIAQRLDLRVKIPAGDGAYPIVAQGEGTDMRTGLILATANGTIPRLREKADTVAGALTNAQELRLRAAQPLPAKAVDRTLHIALNGDMAKYVWALNGQTWPNITPLEVKKGERVELVFTNQTGMAHPMHLHGHVFRVTEIDGQPLSGAKRDTVFVKAGQTVKVQFEADYPGYWVVHCHILYHQAGGMMTVLKYQGFEDAHYNPLASRAEFSR
jgi:FtsP/CotA-like multicopper oxidase with cupredoxin domain